ncbi:hypothetical protein L1887_02849 [Cichorium endivia]|nr:hypothetical protein L1887_02849 [Cichorium endivia]
MEENQKGQLAKGQPDKGGVVKYKEKPLFLYRSGEEPLPHTTLISLLSLSLSADFRFGFDKYRTQLFETLRRY